MARAFPQSVFIGSDYHPASIDQAAARAAEAGLNGQVTFETASAQDFGGGPFDLVTTFDCLHDLGDPLRAARHIREALAPDGTWMIVEPIAGDRPADNLNPVARLYYNASTMICVPTSLAQEVGEALGAQAGEAKITEVLHEGGFANVRRATEGPFNMVLEARLG